MFLSYEFLLFVQNMIRILPRAVQESLKDIKLSFIIILFYLMLTISDMHPKCPIKIDIKLSVRYLIKRTFLPCEFHLSDQNMI